MTNKIPFMWPLKNHNNSTLIVNGSGEKINYGSFLVSSNALANEILTRCIIFCLCKNCTGSLLGYVTFINNKIVPLMLDSKIDKQQLRNLTKIYKPNYFWIPLDMKSSFRNYKIVYSDYNYALIKTNYNHEYPIYKELALLLTTSGSTGSKKLVRLSYSNIKSNMTDIAKYLDLNKTDRTITTLPMNYAYGISIINSYLHVGASIILTDNTIVQKEFWHQLKTYGATSISGVPYTFELLEKLRFLKMKLPTLRTITQAGGKLLPELHEKLAHYAITTKKHFYVMYGQTEATARISYLPYKHTLDKCGSIGIAIPNGKLTLIDSNSVKITKPEINGELVYEGSNVMLGYAKTGSDLVNEDEYNSKLHTGDIAKIDCDGFYWIVGRKSRFLKIFGNRINLDEIELLLKIRFKKMEIACSGIDNNMDVYITNNNKILKVRQYLIRIIRLNKTAFTIKHVNKLPRSESGKIIYKELDKE